MKLKFVLTPEREQQLVGNIISRYPKMDTSKPTNYTLISNKGVEPDSTLTFCHSVMGNSGKAGKYDIMYNGIPYKEGLEMDFVRALIAGPFRNWSDQIELLQVEDHFVLKIINLDKFPANVLYNFCIACRYPLENNELTVGITVSQIRKMIG
jgi:hypothetical protein